MKQERVILSFIMVLIGLLVAGAAFYFYQSTKTVSPSTTGITKPQVTPTPTPGPKVYLSLGSPSDEEVVSNATLSINGKTNPNATIIIIASGDQQVIQPTSLGDFSTTETLDDGQNIIKIQTILPSGETVSVQRTVTYSTENF
jgi:hypothetical protein